MTTGFSSSSKLIKMSSQGLNYSEFVSSTNISCSNSTTIDLSNASSIVINSTIFGLYGANYPRDNLNLIYQFWISVLCVSLFGMITNSSFILTVVKTPSRTTTYILLACLACSDCIFLITQLDTIVRILFDYRGTNASTLVFSSLATLCFLLSTGFVILASAERYLAICQPLKHHKLKGTERTTKLIAIVCLISVSVFAAYLSSHSSTA